jgi:hypothetical protein
MKKSDLVRVIREVIRQEVKKIVKEELKAVLPKKENNPNEFSNMMEHANELFNGPKKQDHNYTADPVLNNVLNETANNTDWPKMGNKTLTSQDALAGPGLASKFGLQSPDKMFGGKPTAEQMVPSDRKHVQIDDKLASVFTRDYSDLMKAIDKKKKK